MTDSSPEVPPGNTSVGVPSGGITPPPYHRPTTPEARGAQLPPAKLRVPTRPDPFLSRQRLVTLLDDLVKVPLTLVVAPAGSGKSAFVADWAHRSPLAVSWLSIDEGDRDVRQLWRSLIAALDAYAPAGGESALTLLRRSRPIEEVVGRLLNDLDGATDEPHVLVIDDLHLVDGHGSADDHQEPAGSLNAFLQHLPTWLHVIAVTRRQPNLPVDRLRARGQLREVRFAELRFSAGEASELLSQWAPTLSEAQLRDATERTDGWVAGLWMEALAARSSHARPVTDAIPAPMPLHDDFIWREVLADEPAEMVEFLLDIGVLDRVNDRLAEALSSRPDVSGLLALAEARGLFVTRLGASGWFELHASVRSALRAELARRSPDRLTEQHARAARWFEADGDVPRALEHLILSQSWREAVRLLAARHGQLYDAGDEAVIQRVIDAIPPEAASTDLDVMLEYAWCHLLVSRRRFAAAVAHASWYAEQTEPDERQLGRLRMLEAVSAVVHVDWSASARLARAGLAHLGTRARHDPIGRFGWNLIARDVALGERWDDAGEEVREAELALVHDLARRLSLEGTRAVGLALAGHPVDALQAIAGIRHAANRTNMSILRTELALAEALAHRELGDRERAASELQALVDHPAEATVYCTLLALLELAETQLGAGEKATARATFERALALAASESVGIGGRSWVARTGIAFAMDGPDLDEARRWADEQRDPFWWAVGTARIHLAAGDTSAAVEALGAAEPRCARHAVVLGLLRARAVQDEDEAAKSARIAVEIASTHEMLRSVADEAPGALDRIEREAWRAPEAWLQRLRRVVAGSGRPVVAGGVEPLTDRERDVLRFLPSRLTTREIADELYVSVNTLKFHLKVIYRKLGVSSRAEAAAKARQMSPR